MKFFKSLRKILNIIPGGFLLATIMEMAIFKGRGFKYIILAYLTVIALSILILLAQYVKLWIAHIHLYKIVVETFKHLQILDEMVANNLVADRTFAIETIEKQCKNILEARN